MFQDKDNVFVCNHGESVFEAAERLGFTHPDYRVGLVAHAKPHDDEVEAVRIKASRNSRGFPIFCSSSKKGDLI